MCCWLIAKPVYAPAVELWWQQRPLLAAAVAEDATTAAAVVPQACQWPEWQVACPTCCGHAVRQPLRRGKLHQGCMCKHCFCARYGGCTGSAGAAVQTAKLKIHGILQTIHSRTSNYNAPAECCLVKAEMALLSFQHRLTSSAVCVLSGNASQPSWRSCMRKGTLVKISVLAPH